MNTADEVLIIILSVVLIILLSLLIWALVYVIKALSSIKRIARDAEKLINSAETVTEAFKSASGPISIIRLINNLGKIVTKERRAK